MKRKFTFLITAALMLLTMMASTEAWGQTQDIKTDIMFAKGFGSYTSNSFGDAGTDYSAIANSTNATGVTYAMQVFNGSTGAVRGNKTGAANFSCRNTTTYVDYYISSVTLTVSGGTLDGSTNGRSVVYFGSSAYSNPYTSAPTGTETIASPNSSGQTTLTWTNTDENVSYFILYNLKTSGTALSSNADTPLTVVWTQKSGGGSDPTITLSDSGTGNIGNYATNTAIYRDFTVTQSNLTADISLEATNGGTFTINDEVVTSIPASDEPSTTEVRWHLMTPQTPGEFTSTITATSGETSATCTYMGYAYTPHSVNIATMEHGTVVADPASAIVGTYVDLTWAPEQGYELGELTIVDANSTPIDYTDYVTYYRFQMPDSNVTVSATFVEASPTTTVTDVLDHDFIGVTSSSYTSWSDKTGISGAVYAGQSAGGDNNSGDCIQLRSNGSNSGIISTASPGKVKKVTVDWNSATASGRTLNVYGSNTAYSAATDLYASNTQGTLLGTIVNGSSTELTISGDYAYVGLRSASGAMYLDEIDIDWAISGTPAPSISAENVNITYDATNGSIAYTINNGVDGGSISAALTDGNWLTLDQGTTSPISFTCSANEAATERTATVTLTYTYGDDETVTKDVTVTQAAAPVIYTTIPALFEAATTTATDVLVTFNNWVVSGVSTNGKNVFVTDNNGHGFVIFDNNAGLDEDYSVNDILSGTSISCSLKKNAGYAQIAVDASDLTFTPGGTVTVAEIAMADLAGVNTSALVHYDNLTCSIDNSGTTPKYNLTDGTTTLQVYNALFAFEALVAGKSYNITGLYQQYNSAKEILPRSAADIEEVVSTEPSITVADATVNIGAEGDEGTLTVTYENITEVVADVWFCDAAGENDASYDWITADINEGNNVEYSVEPNEGEARTAYFKVWAYDDEMSEVYSNLVTVTQAEYIAPSYAELPFSFNGGKADIENTDGLTQEGLGSDYNATSNPTTKLKFDNTGDWLLLQFNERPGTLTFDIKGNSFSSGSTSTFKVQASTDGSAFTDLATYTELGDTESKTFENLDENIRYIKWIYIEKGSTNGGNVGLGNISLTKYVAPVASITVDPTSVEVDAAEHEGYIGIAYQNLTINQASDFGIQFYDSEDHELNGDDEPDWVTAEPTTQSGEEGYFVYYLIEENDDEARTAYFKVWALDDNAEDVYSNLVTVTQAAASAVMYTVNFGLDGGTFVPNDDFTEANVEIAAGTYHLPSATKEGFDLTGWNDGTDTYAAGDEYTVSADVDFTAQWTESATVTYELVTSNNGIVSGAYYYIAGVNNSDAWFAMGQQNSNNRQAVSVTVSNNTIYQTDDVHEVVISIGNDGFFYSIFDEASGDSNGYLYAAGGMSNNYLRTYSIDNYDEQGQWEISIDEETHVATITANITGKNTMRYNSSSNVFSCYGSGQQPIYLFKKVDNTPTISFNGSSYNIGINHPTGVEITCNDIIVSQNNLTENITLTATKGTVTPNSILAGANPTEIVWSYTPTEAGDDSAVITASNGGEAVDATFTIYFGAKTPHNINIASVEHGTIDVLDDKTTAIENENVDFTVTPNEGYLLGEITVMAGETPVDFNDYDTYYRFQMPDSDVTISATFTAVPTYTITFNVNGNLDESLTIPDITQGTSTALPTASTLTPTGFSIAGWALENSTIAVADPYTPTHNVTLYALFQLINAPTASGNYVKVTENLDDWSGEYLIVYETGNVAFDGSLETFDATGNTVAVEISNSTIVANTDMDNAAFTIESMTGGYSIKGTSDKYIGVDSYANGLSTNEDPVANAISIDESGNALITITFTGGDMTLKYNNASNQNRFRYYKSGQQDIQLYKKTSASFNTVTILDNSITWTDPIPATTCVVVEEGVVLTLTNENQGTSENLIIEDGGQLVFDGTGVQATMKKSTAHASTKDGAAADWYTIASPLAANVATSAVGNLTTGVYDLYRYDEATAVWENHKAHGTTDFTELEVGRGYLYWSELGNDITFAGEMRNADAQYTLTANGTGVLKGFNLIGNPFSQNITMDNIIGATLSGGYVLTKAGGWGATVDEITPCQGFLVQVDTETDITITKTPGSKSRANRDFIAFTIANSEYEDVTYALFENTNGLTKINHRNADIPMVYIPQNGTNYAIATMGDDTEMFNLNFKAMTTGQYTLRVDTKGNYNYLHVYDKLTGMDIDMLVEEEYNFIGSPRDAENRFIVRLNYNANIDGLSSSDIFAYQNGDDIIVNGNGELHVYDVMGRFVAKYNVNGIQTIAKPATTGVYILKMFGNDVKTQKIVVR